MKNIQILTALLAVLITTTLFSACSPDIAEEEAEETLLTPEPIPEPEPHWADGIIEIETGRFQTGTEMLRALEKPNNINASLDIRFLLSKPDFPMSRQKKTIKVTVVTLLEAGFTEPATLPEIRKRFKQIGYRPLTLEEAIEIRLQFVDQPDRPKEYNYDAQRAGFIPPPPKRDRTPKSKLDAFHTLMESDEDFLGLVKVFRITRNSDWDKYDQGLCIAISTKNTFDPFAPEYTFERAAGGGIFVGARFACAIEENN